MKHAVYKKRWLGLILAIAMIVSGMCLVQRADSIFVYQKADGLVDYLWKAAPFSLTSPVDAEELSGTRILMRIVQGIRRNIEKIDSEINSNNIITLLWPENFPYFTRLTGMQTETCAALRTIVIQYIHRQDGEKGGPIIFEEKQPFPIRAF